MSAATPPPSDAPPGRILWSGEWDWRQLVEDLHLYYASRPRKSGGPTRPQHWEKGRELEPPPQRLSPAERRNDE